VDDDRGNLQILWRLLPSGVYSDTDLLRRHSSEKTEKTVKDN
jgi:hypothetical protein